MTADAPEFVAPVDAPGSFSTPDHTQSRSVPPGVKKALGKLGANKKPRSGPRQLTAADTTRIADYYDMLAWAMQAYKPAVAQAIKDDVRIGEDDDENAPVISRAQYCAEAWSELAKENDSVRRTILWMVETGAWSKVFMANAPILIAALPDDVLSRLFFTFMPKPDVDETTVDWSAN